METQVLPPRLDLTDCLASDQAALRSLARDLRHAFGPQREVMARQYASLLAQSQAAVAARKARLPEPVFAEDLPVNLRRDEIARLITDNQVLILCGETGSGKTTQLPKIALGLGRGTRGLIGHTQPRRMAARATAARIAQELGSEVGGQLVGYKIRFNDRSSPDTLIKLMTDGILLAETQGDPLLSAYDTLILDEAHERSLNIDFLLGYLKQILPKRPDLKLIITSATLDAARFSEHFDAAPVLEVSGRLYSVEIRYRPLLKPRLADKANAPNTSNEASTPSEQKTAVDEVDLYSAISDACAELQRHGPGDVLVFLPGEREIREAAEALRQNHPPHTEILPLFARLSAEEQARIFKPHLGCRIVLATNVAETSLTVPGIRYVVDTGLARVKRYSYRNKVEQLQVEKIAQAAANQRAGRCGRVAAGICIRLFDEQDFALRPAFGQPEILRSSLAGVILRMKALRLGELANFPFIEKPPAKAINDGYQLLHELGAINANETLTEIGQILAKLPLDPRVARMIVAARDAACLSEVLIIAAALTIQDPRERPPERQASADAAHRLFADEKSEFMSWLKLWQWYAQQRSEHKTKNKLTQRCQAHFLSPARMREWLDVHTQLHTVVAEQQWRENELPASYEAIHRALLAGLLGNIGYKAEDSGHYLGARGMKFLIHPSSALQKKAGKWIAAAELAETSKLFARCVARIDPLWLEEIGDHLIKRSYSDPHWEKKAMQVVAFERSTLYGIVLNARKRVHFGPLNPSEARAIFIRQALVGGEVSDEFERRWAFYRHNQQLMFEIESLEHKSRRPDVLVDDELIFAFYDQLIPEDICTGAGFDYWRRQAEREDAEVLQLKREDLMRHEAAGITSAAFPHQLSLSGLSYELSYHFEPGSSKDGVTLTLPLAQLNQLPAAPCEWLVPGLLKEKVVQLLKTLPHKIRAKLVPLPDFAADFIAQQTPSVAPAESPSCDPAQAQSQAQSTRQPLLTALIGHIVRERGLNARGWEITPDAFRPDALPAHFSMNLKLVDPDGRQLAISRDLNALRRDWGDAAKSAFAQQHAPSQDEVSQFVGMRDWDCGELPEHLSAQAPAASSGATALLGYPGLVDDGDSVSLHVFDSPEAAQQAHQAGLLRLYRLQFRDQLKSFEKNLPNFTSMSMHYLGLGGTQRSAEQLREQLINLSCQRACMAEPWPRDAVAFKARCAEAKPRLGLLVQEIARLVAQVLSDAHTLYKKLTLFRNHSQALQDIEAQLARLLSKNFISDTPFERLQQFPRYLKAATLRLDKLKTDPARDARWLSEFVPLWAQYERRAKALAKQGLVDERLEQFRWLLEELRVQLFAQELRTPTPVSSKRLQKMWEALARD
ncbi:MAG: ATP-dependent RNA helicase HrpA [Pseudomonadota bacterium]